MGTGGLRSAERSPVNGKKDMGLEREVKCEKNSLLPNNVPQKRPGSMPDNELRSKIHGLNDNFFVGVCGLPFRRQKAAGGLPKQIQCT